MDASAPKPHFVSKFGSEITESLRSRLEKLEQAAAFAATFVPKDSQPQKEGQPAPTLDVIIKKTVEKPACLEMFRELAEEEPSAQIRPQTVVTLLQRKILELKKALAAMSDASY